MWFHFQLNQKNLGWYLLSIHGNRDTQRVMTHIAMQAWNILRNKMNQSNQLQSLSMEKFSTSGENVYCVAMPQTGKLAEKKEEAQSLSLAVATLTHNAGYTVLRNKMNECNQSQSLIETFYLVDEWIFLVQICFISESAPGK